MALVQYWSEDGSERPIAFAFRTLALAEKNYSHLEKEGLAIVFGVKKFHEYVYGQHFTIYSDHQPLRHLFNDQKGTPPMVAAQIQRWALTLTMNIGLEGIYRTRMPSADCCSTKWYKYPHRERSKRCRTRPASPVTAKLIRHWTERDPVLSRVLRFVLWRWPSQVEGETLQPYTRRKTELIVLNGCLLWGSRVVVPKQGRMQWRKNRHSGIV